ncbi:MAG TPA: hypothetical protein DCS07_11320 [Bdellovibrionales bacterium]|nr:MAG: hypothetical protein A2Z97_14935 [Bdellovibrionales bacterium GWB1_52_6]OFZ05977.1 MAG: hypothetical protein A2X97_01400 [Bdellovibrionales bacterium GWA1_52_35]OFZ38444.1 MAG: hypothetical protein A2070_03265 [Bdellovibrionales bacterium GWC1_52_8]HAR43198.1 hypothetical protein [Bdellovibrionales bacterium]HCM39404.1 hypothetical protein [Bdellovibrionales bacterium]
MRVFIFIFKNVFLVLTFTLLLGIAPLAWAAPPAQNGIEKSMQEDEDFTPTPYTEYGEFNEDAEEEADTRFFQHGRFFGISIGLGMESADGNRGLLWEGGFPTFDMKVHYWFDFNVALTLGVTTATHFFQTNVNNLQHVDISLIRAGVDLKYYFDTKNLAAPISFANPFILLGGGNYTKTETSFSAGGDVEPQSSLGLCAGAGVEFAIKPKKMYFQMEGKVHLVNFKDTYTTDFRSHTISLDDLTGRFYTFTGNVLFTW